MCRCWCPKPPTAAAFAHIPHLPTHPVLASACPTRNHPPALAEYYADLRNSQEVKALPVTVRTLETIIRLSCAHAKVGGLGAGGPAPGLDEPATGWDGWELPAWQSVLVGLELRLPSRMRVGAASLAVLPPHLLPAALQVRLSAAVERSDVEEVQGLVDIILKSDPSAQETRRPAGRRPEGGAKRGRTIGESDSEEDGDEGMDGGDAPRRAQRGAVAL